MKAPPAIGHKFLERVSKLDDHLALVLSLHLFAEYWINRLIESKSSTAKEILDDKKNNYTFDIKLNLVYNMGLIPEMLYSNLKKLNKLRNKYAHELDFNFLNSDLDYFDPDHRINIKEFKKVLSNENTKHIDPKNALLWIGVVTFGWLNNHCKDVHGLEYYHGSKNTAT